MEPAKSEAVQQEAPMEVDTPDTTAKEEKTEPVEEEMEVEEIKIISEPATTEPEKTEPEPVTATEEEVGFFTMVVAFSYGLNFRWLLLRRRQSKRLLTCPKRLKKKRQSRRSENPSWKSRLMTITNLDRLIS